MPDPLDEQQWQRPEIPQWYMQEGPRQGFPWASAYMHENMIHRYLSEAPYFDFTSKNGLPIDQSSTDPGAWALTHNRREFEQWLSQRDGIEYMIVDGTTFDPATGKNGIWLIRKQDRKKVAGRDELAILGTYFLIRENMYQAPSVADVIGSRLLTATTALSDFFKQASSLPYWSPTTGYTYLPPQRADSPPRSREGSAVPGSRSGSVQPTAPPTNDDGRRALASLRNTLQYADEYADENAIIGEPGHFTFTSSTAAVKKRKADEEAAAVLKAKEAAKAMPAVLKTERPPPAVLSEAKTKPDRRGSKMGEKIRKRKSRANITPTTPLANTTLPPS